MTKRLLDCLCIIFLMAVILFLILPGTNAIFIKATEAHPLMMAYAKFAILAGLGECIGIRLRERTWKLPGAFCHRVILWGFFGVLITIYMKLFSNGVHDILESGYLLLPNKEILFAFLTSTFLNGMFGPSFMTLHKLSDTYLDLKVVEKQPHVSLKDVVNRIDWQTQIRFVVFKTIPFFWIPVHTITFLLPEVYRTIVSALLSLALSLILFFAKTKKTD
ncbi:hypothetical protein [Anaerotignum sp.]|uniref:hypothetical protein n=1 Tax=Anaerotignum sp. TaxID=2039241 RepID=UPI003735D0CF